jgi:hypothetical protein
VNSWKYFGRTAGGPNIFEICRFPNTGVDLDNQDWTRYPEWLQPDGQWKFYPNDNTICNEQITGYFDEHIDELQKEEVDKLHSMWLAGKWPGRMYVRSADCIQCGYSLHGLSRDARTCLECGESISGTVKRP